MRIVERWSEGILPSKTRMHPKHEYIHDTHKRYSIALQSAAKSNTAFDFLLFCNMDSALQVLYLDELPGYGVTCRGPPG